MCQSLRNYTKLKKKTLLGISNRARSTWFYQPIPLWSDFFIFFFLIIANAVTFREYQHSSDLCLEVSL